MSITLTWIGHATWLVDTGAGTLRALHTPGHADGHLAYQVDDGDEVSGMPAYTEVVEILPA